MPIASFARRIFGLQDVFPSSDRSIPGPEQLDNVVQPVYPFPPPQSGLDRVERVIQASSVSAVPAMTMANIPQGFYEEWLWASILQDDAAARTIRVTLEDPTGLGVDVGRYNVPGGVSFNTMVMIGGAFGGQLIGGAQGVDRPSRLWIPPGWRLTAIGETAVSYGFTIVRMRILHPLAEIPIFPG